MTIYKFKLYKKSIYGTKIYYIKQELLTYSVAYLIIKFIMFENLII